MGTLTIMVGIAGSGKDTVIKKYHNDAIVLSSDEIRKELYGYEDQTHNSDVFIEMNRRAKEAGKAGFHVIYNATNLNRGRRVGLCNDMKKYFDSIEVVVCVCSIETLLKRNITREERHIPEEKLKQMIKSIQLPTYYEYPYDKITYILTDNIKSSYLERLDELDTYEQHNKYHSEPLGLHIKRVASACKKNLKAYTAALYHDLGKPFCKTIDSEGYYHFISHPLVSAYMYIVDMLYIHDGEDINDWFDVMLIIEFHDYIFNFQGDFQKMKMKLKNKYKDLDDEFFKSLEMVVKADRLRP